MVSFKFRTAATTRSTEQFSPFTVKGALYDDMATIREKAWQWCHSATSEPFADDKLYNSPLNVVVDGKVVG